MVSIHMPICGAPPEHVRRALAQLALLDYPAFEVLVVDHNTADPELWEPVARDCARLDARFRFFHLGPLSSGRAGALNFARAHSAQRAQFIAVVDYDDVEPRDWLRKAMARFADPWIGAVRSPCMVRRDALDDAGGWAEWCVAEDMALELELLRRRWHCVTIAREADRDLASLGARRMIVTRHAQGAAQIARRHWRPLFSPFCRELTMQQRWPLFASWMPWAVDALGLPMLIISLAMSIGALRTPTGFEAPALLCMLPMIGLLALRLARVGTVGVADAIAGMTLSHAVAKAVWGALLNKELRPGAVEASRAWTPGIGREELALLLLTWGTAVAVAQGSGGWRSLLWCAVLLAMSMPYLAAVSAGVLSARRARRPKTARPGLGMVARTEAGD